jgi:hypothetical protein
MHNNVDEITSDLFRLPSRPRDTMDLARTIRDVLSQEIATFDLGKSRALAERLVRIYPAMVGPEWNDQRLNAIERRLADHTTNYRSWRRDLTDTARRLREIIGTVARLRSWTTSERERWPIAKAYVAALLAGVDHAGEPDVDAERAAFIARSPEPAELREVVEALTGTIRRQRAESVADAFEHARTCDREGCSECRTFTLSWGLDVWKQLRGASSPRVRIVRGVPR